MPRSLCGESDWKRVVPQGDGDISQMIASNIRVFRKDALFILETYEDDRDEADGRAR